MDTERTVQFLLEQVAKLAADFAEMNERLTKRADTLEERLGQLAHVAAKSVEIQERHVDQMGKLTGIAEKMAEQMGHLVNDRVGVEERLGALITITDELIRRSREDEAAV